MKKTIIFRTEASPEIGMGHLIRSLSLAQMLKYNYDISFSLGLDNEKIKSIISAEGFVCDFVGEDINTLPVGLENADIVVLDGYRFTSLYQKSIKEKVKKLVCIDDIHAVHFYSDVVINFSGSVTENDYSAENYTRFYFGSDYALLRNPFLASAALSPRKIITMTEAFINMGGADIANNTHKVIKAIEKIPSFKKIHAVIGSVNPNKEAIKKFINENNLNSKIDLRENITAEEMSVILSATQLAICPASGISVEVSSIGVPMISGYTADNQLGILKDLTNKACVLNAGNFNELTEEQLSKIINDCIFDLGKANDMIRNQKKMIDGRSSERLLQLFNNL